MAELADALDLGSGDLTVVGVRVSPSALARPRFLTNSSTWIKYEGVRPLCFYMVNDGKGSGRAGPWPSGKAPPLHGGDRRFESDRVHLRRAGAVPTITSRLSMRA